jgi:micrococcal nuclease
MKHLIIFLIVPLSFFVTRNIGYTEVISPKTETSQKPQITFKAKVIRIIDGDTCEILYHELPIKIRLAHIDCPEKRGKQPFGNVAKKALSDLCFGTIITVQTENSFDRSGRLIAVLLNESGENINKQMVSLGMAWHYKKYSEDQSYDLLEIEARKNKLGLWRDKKPIAPWNFRN